MGKSWEQETEQKRNNNEDFHVGCLVELYGLVERADLNGNFGRIIAFNNKTCRWKVVLHGSGTIVMVKAENLKIDTNTDLDIEPIEVCDAKIDHLEKCLNY